MNEDDREDKPEGERDEMTEEELATVAGGAATGAPLDLKRSALKSSKITNPIVNVGMEKNEAQEHPASLGNTIKIK